MRLVLGNVLAALAALLVAGCGGDSESSSRAPVGPTLEATLANYKGRAACKVLLRYAENRRDAMSMVVSKMEQEAVASPSVDGGAESGDVRNAMPGANGEGSDEMANARAAAAQWGGLVLALKGPGAEKCFEIKEWRLADVKGDRATCRLVVELTDAHKQIAPGDLAFDVMWNKVVRPGVYRDAQRLDWELGDSRLSSGGNETKPE